ncbi:MAG: hypothetical protein H6R19_1789 [Proteobacteria bacterium]|nr:hypothetical protein [Pseudomonadota bacterium]
MAVARLIAKVLPGALLGFAQRLRFPHLFLLILVVFAVDLLLPDFIPFIDEILLGMLTLLLAAWEQRKEPK